jgi:mxaJ protein
MSSRFPELALLAALAAACVPAAAQEPRTLRVCADPDNMPYSHADGGGFENRIATLLAEELHATLQYDWWPQRRGYVRKTLGADMCDVFIGVPADFDRVATTRPYYRSSFVFVSRRGEPAPKFGTPQITSRRIGVQLVGNDMAATPPGHALTQAGATAALVWGPQAGYFARRAAVPLSVQLAAAPSGVGVPFEFSIAMGVKRGNQALRDELDAFLVHRRADIDAILASYQVPRTDAATGGQP